MISLGTDGITVTNVAVCGIMPVAAVAVERPALLFTSMWKKLPLESTKSTGMPGDGRAGRGGGVHACREGVSSQAVACLAGLNLSRPKLSYNVFARSTALLHMCTYLWLYSSSSEWLVATAGVLF